jgi:hypothetical protein
VIGVLGIYGQITEAEIQAEADTIIQTDTIGTENLQIEGDTASSIKDSLFTEESKKYQQEIIEKKDSSISCCLSGKNQPEQKSKWSFGIGYVGSYNSAIPDMLTDYVLYQVEWFGELSLNDWLRLYNYWINGLELSYLWRLENKNCFELNFSTGYFLAGYTDNKGIYSYYDGVNSLEYKTKSLSNYSLGLLYSKNCKYFMGVDIIYSSIEGEEVYHLNRVVIDTVEVNRKGIGVGFVGKMRFTPFLQYKKMSLSSYMSLKIGGSIEVWNDSPWKDIWQNNRKYITNYTGVNFGIQINWR